MIIPAGVNQLRWDNPIDPDTLKDSEEKELKKEDPVQSDQTDLEYALSAAQYDDEDPLLDESPFTDEQINELYDEDLGIGGVNPDALGDEEYKKFLEGEKARIAAIEAKTTAILVNLQTVVDGMNRKDIKKAILPPLQKQQSDKSAVDDPFQDYNDLFRESRFTSFRRESNFDDQNFLGRSGNTLETINKLISKLTFVLFGFGTTQNGSEEQRSFEEMESDLNVDRKKWEAELGKAYQAYYRRNIEEAFSQAESLINERKDYAKTLLIQRIALYSTAIIAAAGMIVDKKMVTYVSLGLSASTLVWIFYKHVSSSYSEAKLAAKLQSSVEFLEEIGATNIISDP